MRFRDQVALTLPALFLRVMLASIFIWAGLVKITTTVPVTPEQAAALDSLDVPVGPPLAPEPEPVATPRLPDPDDTAQADDQSGDPTDDAPDSAPVETPAPDAALPEPDAGDAPPTDGALLLTAWTQDDDTGAAETEPAEPPAERTGLVTAADYPEGGTVRTVEMLALVIDNATNPPLDDQSNQADQIWPDAIGTGPWPRVNAWAVAITELAAGVFILLGLLTRLSALSLFTVMLGAMWLTQIGPAMQLSATRLGFLPDYALNDFASWTPLWMQFALAMSALALVFLGAGPLSLDRAIFRRSRESYDAGPKYTTATDPPPETQRPV